MFVVNIFNIKYVSRFVHLIAVLVLVKLNCCVMENLNSITVIKILVLRRGEDMMRLVILCDFEL